LSIGARFGPHLAALIIYTALTLVASYPLPLHLATHFGAVPGELGQDVWQHAWNVWWVREAVVERFTNPYTTDMLFYPQGASLALHSLNLPLGLIGIPFLPLLGLVATYNLLTMLTMVLAGYTTFLLARWVVRYNADDTNDTAADAAADAAAVVAGAIVFCSPQRLIEWRGAQLATLADYGVPLTILAVLWMLDQPTWRRSAVVAGAILITGLSKWYHVFHLIPVLGILFVWWAINHRHTLQQALSRTLSRETFRAAVWPIARPWLQMAVASGIAVAPFLLPAIADALTIPYEPPVMTFNADPDLFFPDHFGGIWQTVPIDWWEPRTFGYLPFLFVILGMVVASRRIALWAVIGGICFLLSLGTQRFSIGGVMVPMPYTFFDALPVVGMLRSPYRINSVTTLMMALIAAWGVAWFLSRLSRLSRAKAGRGAGQSAWVIAIGITLLLAAETVRLPFPLDDASLSPFYRKIGGKAGAWSVLEFPFNRVDRDRLEMYAQTTHEHFILTGKTSRDVKRLPYEGAMPIRHAEEGSIQPDILTMSDGERDRLLRALRVRYLIVHPDTKHPAKAQQKMDRQISVAGETLSPLTRVYSDTKLQAYELDRVATWLEGPGAVEHEKVPLFLALDERWNPREPDGEALARWLPQEGAGVWAYAQQPRRAALTIALYSFGEGRPLEVWLNGELAQRLPIADGHRVRRYYTSPLPLRAGANLIELRSPMGGISPKTRGLGEDTRPLSFCIYQIDLVDIHEP
jgi:hypothetical protein